MKSLSLTVLKDVTMYKSISKTMIFMLFLSINLFAKNPVYSPTFDDIMLQTLPNRAFTFDDENITIKVPNYADNPTQVPIFIDASKIKDAKRVIVFADLNPLPQVLDMQLIHAKPILSFNIRVAQETPLRALVQDAKGAWHVGSANIKSAGGGCSVSDAPDKSKAFARLLGQHKSQVTRQDNLYRIKFSIFHPMETGLMFGKASFYIEDIELYTKELLLAKLSISSSISQNPRMLLQTSAGEGDYMLILNDTDANTYEIPAHYGE